MARICIDTDFLLAFLLGNENEVRKLQFYLYEELAISAITALELRCIVENVDVVNALLHQVTVLPITEKVANIAANLMLEHKTLSLPDALVASTCLHYNAFLLTTRRNVFDGVRGLRFV
jgi:predicted nucleic acid-binding protein